jgi:segregation and condensation protein B
MEIAQIIPHVEALIFASDHPLPAMEIMELLNNSQGFLEDLATPDQVMSAIEAIREKYSSAFYAFEVRQSGGGFQFLTKAEYYPTVAQLNGDKYLKKLSTAALETLAIIAYKQPITKGDIESIRGVNSDYSIQKLLEKELIMISGRKEDVPGKPLLYVTSKSFMDYFGLNTPADLPQIKEVLQEELTHPTHIHEHSQDNNDDSGENETLSEQAGYLSVSENGELMITDDTGENSDDMEESNNDDKDEQPDDQE